MSRTMSYYDLQDALAQPDCAVCRLKAKAAEQHLDSLLWEHVNDPGVRYKIRQSRGFCHEHAWGLVRQRASVGMAIIMQDVLKNVLRGMEDAQFQALPTLSLRRSQEALNPKLPVAATAEVVAQLAPQAPCPTCVEAETMEDVYLIALIENLIGEDGLLAAYQSSDGLCLPHFRQALTRVRDEMTFTAMLNVQQAIWKRLDGLLSEIIRKSDYRFQSEPRKEESGASLRAIAAISGARSDRGE